MDNFQLTDIIANDECLRKVTLGVFSRDTLPTRKILKFPCGLIVNSDKANQPGTHWLALYAHSPKKIAFFDSFGKNPFLYGVEIDKFICNSFPEANGNYEWNTTQLQDMSSSMCGLFCLYFMYFSCRGESLRQIVNKFEYPKNLKKNDLLLKLFAKSRLHLCTNPHRCIHSKPKFKQYALPMYKVLY